MYISIYFKNNVYISSKCRFIELFHELRWILSNVLSEQIDKFIYLQIFIVFGILCCIGGLSFIQSSLYLSIDNS